MPTFKASRPAHYPYSFKAFLDLPRRLLSPPKAGVGTVRSFKITPIYDIALNDVLDGKHLPPLGLKDFEEYLLFVEHSAENLYFIFWLRDYIAKYRQWQESIADMEPEKRPTSNPDLTISFSRARGTFFDSSSHLELNLPSDPVERLFSNPTSFPHPTPEAFHEIQKQVEGMLRESLMTFVGNSCGNSGRNRGIFGIFVGLSAMAVGLAPILLSVLEGKSRWMRLGALLPFWFGAMVVIASLHGVCVVIFLFGDARQLYPFELARPSLSAPLLTETSLLPLPVTSPTPGKSAMQRQDSMMTISGGSSDMERKVSVSSHQSGQENSLDGNNGTTAVGPASNYAFSFQDTAGFISPYAASFNSEKARSSPPVKFDFDSLPIPPSPRASEEDRRKSVNSGSDLLPTRGVFCSLTKVVSPVITRAQWEIVMRSAIMGIFVALILGGACFAIPHQD